MTNKPHNKKLNSVKLFNEQYYGFNNPFRHTALRTNDLDGNTVRGGGYNMHPNSTVWGWDPWDVKHHVVHRVYGYILSEYGGRVAHDELFGDHRGSNRHIGFGEWARFAPNRQKP